MQFFQLCVSALILFISFLCTPSFKACKVCEKLFAVHWIAIIFLCWLFFRERGLCRALHARCFLHGIINNYQRPRGNYTIEFFVVCDAGDWWWGNAAGENLDEVKVVNRTIERSFGGLVKEMWRKSAIGISFHLWQISKGWKCPYWWKTTVWICWSIEHSIVLVNLLLVQKSSSLHYYWVSISWIKTCQSLRQSLITLPNTFHSSFHKFCFNFPLQFHPHKPSNDLKLFEAHFSAATIDETSREITSPPMMNAPKSATKNNFFLYPLEHNGK
jgi:hypothetical protein